MGFTLKGDDRFEIVDVVKAGGMSTVYRARDRQSSTDVAVKVAKDVAGSSGERFAREVRLLESLDHPRIVRHVAHGVTVSGQPYLAMEWLEGEDLSQTLAERALSPADVVQIGLGICEALAAAHAQGIVHRDIKPSNIFLVGGDATGVKVLDFGVARPEELHAVTVPGAMLGTAGYMAPEQIRSAADVDTRADVFAVGCVLYECLVGRPAFVGSHPLAIVAKLLVEDIPRVSQARPDLDPALDTLIAMTMAKERSERPADAIELAERLAALDIDRADNFDTLPPPPTTRRNLLSQAERELVSALLVRRAHQSIGEDEAERLDAISERFGASVSTLDRASLLLVLRSTGEAVDQAARAAQCALSLQKVLPDAVITVGTGGARNLAGRHVGPAIDSAVELLDTADGPSILLDHTTDGLLDPRFERMGTRLLGERTTSASARRVLGRSTPCIGRQKELAFLESTLEECLDYRLGQAVLVTAKQGFGKSRLRQEFVQRVRNRGGVEILEARGAGSALGMARQLVRARLADADGDPGTFLRAHLRQLPRLEEPDRVADFLGDLAGVPTREAATPQLEAALDAPRIMAEWTERSFVEWLLAEARAAPLLLVIEDLHWGDQSTVSYLGRALREAEALPLMLLATARPEVHGAFPTLSKGWGMHELPLRPLHIRDATRLARAVAGDGLPEPVLRRLVRLADGNAFFLEELIRHASERSDEPPATVLACVEARLAALPSDARKVLRAASVFGERFWDSAICRLVGVHSAEVGQWLDTLEELELVDAVETSRFPDEREREFRHALFRAAAYGSLTDEDRSAAHLLAGEWLEEAGERDARILLDHFDLGDDVRKAGRYAVTAAEAALTGMDLREALGLCVRGLSLDVTGVERARLLAVNAMAACWAGRPRDAIEPATEALSLAPVGSATWTSAVATRLYSASTMMRATIAGETIEVLSRVGEQMKMTPSLAFATTLASRALAEAGEGELSQSLVRRLAVRSEGGDPGSLAWYQAAAGWAALGLERDLGRALEFAEASLSGFEAVGDALGRVMGAQLLLVHLELELGQQDAVLARPAEVGDLELGSFERTCQARVHIERGDWDLALMAAKTLETSQVPRFRAIAKAIASRAHLGFGNPERARTLANESIEVSGHLMYSGSLALLAAAEAELAVGNPAVAKEHAERALGAAGSATLFPSTWFDLASVHLRALEALAVDTSARRAEVNGELERVRGGLPTAWRQEFRDAG